MLILGIILAVALPAALGQPRPDPVIKSAVRNAVSELETCYVSKQTYKGCRLPDARGGGLEFVTVANATRTTYTVRARTSDGVTYRMARTKQGAFKRTCTPAGAGECPANSRW